MASFKLLVYKAALTADSCSQSGLEGGQAIPKAALRAVLPCHVYLAKYTSFKKSCGLFAKVVIGVIHILCHQFWGYF